MNNSLKCLPYGLLLLLPAVLYGNEYIPPPTGPYQSTVVINTVEQNSVNKQHVYKFPQADLIQPRSPEPIFPSGSYPGLNDDGMKKPASAYEVLRPTPSSSVNEGRIAPSTQPAQPQYDASMYNNPWSVNATPPQQGYQGEWNMQQYPYGYYQYPYGYSNQYGYSDQYNMKNTPFSFMPSPWSVMPSKPYSGR